MRVNITVVGGHMQRLPGGEFTGEGPWEVLKCVYDGKAGHGEFYVAINREEGLLDITPKDPRDKRTLSRAFDAMLSFRDVRA